MCKCGNLHLWPVCAYVYASVMRISVWVWLCVSACASAWSCVSVCLHVQCVHMLCVWPCASLCVHIHVVICFVCPCATLCACMWSCVSLCICVCALPCASISLCVHANICLLLNLPLFFFSYILVIMLCLISIYFYICGPLWDFLEVVFMST